MSEDVDSREHVRSSNPGSLVPNRPTDHGRELGAEVARLCDAAEAEQRKRFPKMRERCSSCAFRGGTFPNGCESTLMDALKSVMEMDTFMCHMDLNAERKPQRICAGWFMALTALGPNAQRVTVPWSYSHEDDEERDYADAAYASQTEEARSADFTNTNPEQPT